MQPEDTMRIGHVLKEAARVAEWIKGQTYESFLEDSMLNTAVTHAVQIVGEACWQMSDAFKAQEPDIEWDEIAGMRHRLVHAYFEVDLRIVWAVATVHLPQLRARLLPCKPSEDE